MFQIESQGAVDVIAPQVALNHENAVHLLNAITEKSFVGQPMVVIDMTNVPLIDSAGLECLLDVQTHLRQSSGSLKFASLSQLCEDVFRVTGLADRFETYADTKTAAGSFVR